MAAGDAGRSPTPPRGDKALAEGGDPKGTVQDPTITLHTAADPLVIVQNETYFLDRYTAAQKAGTATARARAAVHRGAGDLPGGARVRRTARATATSRRSRASR